MNIENIINENVEQVDINNLDLPENMQPSISGIVKVLKEQEEDFEFYPTTDEMLAAIAPYLECSSVLDIGCGLCKFKQYMDNDTNDVVIRRGYTSTKSYSRISKYYVIEKSKVLLKKLDENTICLGTDFLTCCLADKKVDVIFCNPPYSQFKLWTIKIISEGNYLQAFLIIPQRWQKDEEIQKLLAYYNTDFTIIGSFDFLEADRKARAKVDVVRFVKQKYQKHYFAQEDFDIESFDEEFNKMFGINKTFADCQKERKEEQYNTLSIRKNEQQQSRIKNEIAQLKDNKAERLVRLYNEDYKHLIDNLKAIMQLDEEILKDFNVSVNSIKEAFIKKIKGLKVLYWNIVFDEFEEVTSRLTRKSRDNIKLDFNILHSVEFTVDNIYSLILWVVKNANKYYNSQLVTFYKELSREENVKPYKSNTKLFDKDNWRWNNFENKTKYVLDYRIVMSSPFQYSYSGRIEKDYGYNTLDDIAVVARNLGFNINTMIYPNLQGQKVEVYLNNGEKFMEYRAYKNRNLHVKFNQEFTKALNVEVARLLGWIKNKEDIKREFPENIAKGAEKYFKTNYTVIENANRLMIENV